ncbi:hypothetical protein Fcan01_25574 [Folsomia candida]|uniref:Uncharacterized protein n=2 Tax=Folsomia candida TaxID=158441 RepID=A0A226D3Q4_FOLCA|nr:hypothetical protein Fcan01_25574 [Folsomia candida]
MNGTILKIVGAEWKGVLNVATEITGSKTFISGAAFEMLLDLQFILNFKPEFTVVDDYFPDHPTNSSIAYHLSVKNADIAIGLLYYVLPRLAHGSILVPLGNEPFQAYFLQPSVKNESVYHKPLPISLLLSMVLLLAIICILTILSSKNSTVVELSFRDWIVVMLKSVFWAFATISQQVLLSGGLMCSTMLYIYYAASILSYFNRDVVETIQNFTQLLISSFSVYTVSSVTSTLLENHGVTHETFTDVGQNASILKIFQRGHAHLDTDDIFYPDAESLGIPNSQVCTVSKVKVLKGGGLTSGFYCQQGFEHREGFNFG